MKARIRMPGKGYTGYPPANVTRNRTLIRASHDQARTWGVIYPMDSDEYPAKLGAALHGREKCECRDKRHAELRSSGC